MFPVCFFYHFYVFICIDYQRIMHTQQILKKCTLSNKSALNRPELLGVRLDNNGHDLRGVLFVGIDKDCRGREGVLPLRYSRSSKTIWEDNNMPWPLEL